MNTEEQVTITVSAGDLRTISNALNEVCQGPEAIPEWEFQTRMGVDRDEAKQTLRQIGDAL